MVKIITNKYCNGVENLGRNTKYKSKKLSIYKLIHQSVLYLKGSDSEISNIIKVLNEIDIENVIHLKKSNK